MQRQKRTHGIGTTPHLNHRQSQRQQHKKQGIKIEHPMQANNFFDRQKRKKRQRKHHQSRQQRPTCEGLAKRCALPPSQPHGARGEQVKPGQRIQRGLVPTEGLALVAVVHIEHDVRPAVSHVPPEVDGWPRQRSQHHEQKAQPAFAAVNGKVQHVRKANDHGKVFGQESAGQKQTAQAVQRQRLSVLRGAQFSAHHAGDGEQRPKNQRRIGGDEAVEPVQRREPKQQNSPSGFFSVDGGKSPPHRRPQGQRQHHGWPADGQGAVAK